MKNLAALCVVALLAASCASKPPATSQSGASGPPACDTQTATEWSGADNRAFRVTASASGANCAQAVVLLVVRDASGNVVWTDARASAHVMGLNEPTTRAEMTRALADWIGFPLERLQTTAHLAPWPETSGQPGESAFPFQPEAWINQEYYEHLAGEARPMFCYIQGMESIACLVESHDRLEKIGVQSFPG